MPAERTKFEDYLKSHNLKLTRERRLILDEIMQSNRHIEAEDVVYNLKNKGKKVSRATVYRTLELLKETGLVRRVCLGENQYRYEQVYGKEKHNHLVCVKCGNLIEFENEQVDHLQAEICQAHEFQMVTRCFQIFGFCQKCK